MKKLLSTLVATSLAFGTGIAFAGHDDGVGGVASPQIFQLARAARQLETEVRYSGLHYGVRSTVDRFAMDVERLLDCARGVGGGHGGGGPIIVDPGHGHPFPHLGGGGPVIIDVPNGHGDGGSLERECRFELRQVRMGFREVERLLYDTQYDFPRVHRAFLVVDRAMRAVGAGGGHGGGGGHGELLQCIAVDAGWEEHREPHVGYGRNVVEAQRQAMNACQAFHGRCQIRSCGPVR